MNDKGTLPVHHPFNMKVFLFIALLLIPAAYAILPFTLTLSSTPLELIGLPRLLGLTLVNVAIYIALAACGLFLAGKIGLGLPFVERWVRKEPMWNTFGKVLLFSILIGILFAVAVIVLDYKVFGPPLQSLIESRGIVIPESVNPPPWQGALASFSAGVTEEVIFRLFGLTVLAFLGSLLFHDKEGQPHLAVLWISNILIAAGFGLAHLPATAMIGIPLTPLVITRAVVLNGIGGTAFGWLYWTRGLESAMVAHFSGDIVLHVIVVMVASLL